MKLVEIVNYFESEASLQEIYSDLKLEGDSDNIGVYMKNSIDINSDIYFFDEAETGDLIEITKEGIKYFNLFSLGLGVEFYSYFKDYFEINNYSDLQKAQRLVEYVIYDA